MGGEGIAAHIQREITAASENAYYAVAHFHPRRGPRPSASLWHGGSAIQPSLGTASAPAEPKPHYPNLSAPSHLTDKRLISRMARR